MSAVEDPVAVRHGVLQLTSVTVKAYNAEIRDGEGFVGDRARKSVFHDLLEETRGRLRKVGDDPLGDKPTSELGKRKLDKVLAEGDPEAAAVVQGAIEAFAGELAKVTMRFLKLKAWRDVRRIVVGGGLRGGRIGELAIGRASVLVKSEGHEVELRPIHYDPDEAGLIGALHLVPPWMLTGYRGILAVDIGGSNIRVGIVSFDGKEPDFAKSAVEESDLWRYCDEEPKPGRTEVVKRIGEMSKRLVRHAQKRDLELAPFLGIACPGVIADDGSITHGGHNLPGNWESSRFNLPAEIRTLLPRIGNHEVTIVMHNDAVVQGLSELPHTQDVAEWGVFTIGTGLGNAAFKNRTASE